MQPVHLCVACRLANAPLIRSHQMVLFPGGDQTAAAPPAGPTVRARRLDGHEHVPGVRQGLQHHDAQAPLPPLRPRALQQVRRPGGAHRQVRRAQARQGL